jgi:hypothetical protein
MTEASVAVAALDPHIAISTTPQATRTATVAVEARPVAAARPDEAAFATAIATAKTAASIAITTAEESAAATASTAEAAATAAVTSAAEAASATTTATLFPHLNGFSQRRGIDG